MASPFTARPYVTWESKHGYISLRPKPLPACRQLPSISGESDSELSGR